MTQQERDRTRLREFIIDEAVTCTPTTLSSGEESDFYIDLRQVTMSCYGSPMVGRMMLDLVDDLDFEAVGGMTLGADPVAAAMMHATTEDVRPFDVFVVRKEPKTHGMAHAIEGPSIKNRRVLIVDDVVTTGRSAVEAVITAQNAGAEVVAVASVVRRGTAHLLAPEIEHRTLFTLRDLGLEPPPPVKPHKWSWKDIQVVSHHEIRDQVMLLCPGPDCDEWYATPHEFNASLKLLKRHAKEHIKKAHGEEGSDG